jgi:signal peptidase I
MKDAVREVVETVVFVVVLVLLLKTFVAEAFVIPTGSMAETLLGYQKWVECPQCHEVFPVNCSAEVDPQDGRPVPVTGCRCPNCRYHEIWLEADFGGAVVKQIKAPPSWGSGDRVLVAKFPFDNSYLSHPERYFVVVFKYPQEPQKNQIPMNYIKRLIGLPGETIAIFNGDLYVCRDIDYPEEKYPRPERKEDLWRIANTYENAEEALEAWKAEGRFQILRKSPDHMMALRRLVYDNDHQAADLAGKVEPRWKPTAAWTADDDQAPRVFRNKGAGAEIDWIHYQHLIVERSNEAPINGPREVKPSHVTNFMGYNGGDPVRDRAEPWVGDLMLECTAQVDNAQGELVLEVSRGVDRFQARFQPADGTCTLVRIGADDQEIVLDKKPTKLNKPGSYKLRFANFDQRLTVWVDGQLPFGDGTAYEPPKDRNEAENDVKRPASFGARDGLSVQVSHVGLYRDTYYTTQTDHDPRWGVNGPVKTFYVQPGHFMCMGDNSSESSDSRFWGLVPERLMLGRALLVYYPFTRGGPIR